jgi:hypothetical protein
MKWLFAPLIALVLAGCADVGNFDAPTGHILSTTETVSLSTTKTVSPKVLTARPKATNANGSTNNLALMECVSDSCKVQCSPQIEKHSRPKWCMYFKEPIDRHALRAKSDELRNSAD